MIWLWIYLGGGVIAFILTTATIYATAPTTEPPPGAFQAIFANAFLWPLAVLIIIGVAIGWVFRGGR